MLVAVYIYISIACGLQIPINSGYRSAEHNLRVGGAPKSRHITRRAFDLNTLSFTAKEKQCIIREATKAQARVFVYPAHIHIDTRLP